MDLGNSPQDHPATEGVSTGALPRESLPPGPDGRSEAPRRPSGAPFQREGRKSMASGARCGVLSGWGCVAVAGKDHLKNRRPA